MVTALKYFLQNNHYALKTIEQKFCEPGHSSIQEVDSVHSQIEKALSVSEIYSPVSLLRVLTKVRKKSMKIIELQPGDFLNFQATSQSFKFSEVPFTKVKYIRLDVQDPLQVSFKESFVNDDFNDVSIVPKTRKKDKPVIMPKVSVLSKSNILTADKVKDLKAMLKYMPLADRQYYQNSLEDLVSTTGADETSPHTEGVLLTPQQNGLKAFQQQKCTTTAKCPALSLTINRWTTTENETNSTTPWIVATVTTLTGGFIVWRKRHSNNISNSEDELYNKAWYNLSSNNL
ncbi:unnamed protein product [Mytilus edulis]|uniref:Uncharacterized protein n=1 Tax=Mytilus edulis TaxID=6550 RepID=A0A8S3VB00_MYTED|nr:unnamed protein product [Mytilus edulis]